MKIATTTFHCAINYGAVLQAYSLIRYLNDIGHEARVVDYWPHHRQVANSPFLPSRMLSPSVLLRNGLSLLHYRELMRKIDNFAAFREEYIPATRVYTSFDELVADLPPVDCFITGSDQVWNPRTGIDPVYFLDFVKSSNARTVAYAPSIGNPWIDDAQRARMAQLMGKIHHLSSREYSGSELIQSLTGRESATVVDPVLLQNAKQWLRICEPVEIAGDYILVYGVRRRKSLERVVLDVKRQTGMKVVQVVGTNPLSRGLVSADHVVWDAGPKDFVSLIANAKGVITNSFHGTAFSIIFRKPFLSVSHTEGDTRAHAILQRCGQLHRLIAPGASTPSFLENWEGDWVTLEKEISMSKAYLESAIG